MHQNENDVLFWTFYLVLERDSSKASCALPSLVLRSVRARFFSNNRTHRPECDSAAVCNADCPISFISFTRGTVFSSPQSNAEAQSTESNTQQRWRSLDKMLRSKGSEEVWKNRFKDATSWVLSSWQMDSVTLVRPSAASILSSVELRTASSLKVSVFPQSNAEILHFGSELKSSLAPKFLISCDH